MYGGNGMGAGWQASSYVYADASTGHVLWTKSATGRAALWTINAATGAIAGGAFIVSVTGMGSPWTATGYEQPDANTGYLLWTRSDTGQAVIWTMDPSVVNVVSGSPVIPVISTLSVNGGCGLGVNWQGTSLVR